MVRGRYVDKNGVRKGAWTQEEDDKLRAYVEQYGHSNWRLLPKFAGLLFFLFLRFKSIHLIKSINS